MECPFTDIAYKITAIFCFEQEYSDFCAHYYVFGTMIS